MDNHSKAAVSDILVQMLNITHQQASLVEALQLPKAEMMTFDGDQLKLWMFTRVFGKLCLQRQHN